ncbi:MAG: glycosyltransferase family 2 protein [Pseudomonadota bacterium]
MMISTIMVCRNAASTIAGSVESFLAQDHAEKELVVVDGASSDGTLDVLAKYSDPSIKVESGQDGGIYNAMNKGLERFQGAGFGFLNADDRYTGASVLSEIARALKTAEIVTGNLNFVSRHGARPVRVWPSETYYAGAFRRGWSPPHPTTYARRSVYERVGPFEPSFRIAGDYDWLLRALEIEGASHGTIDATLVDMALGGVSTASWRTPFQNAAEKLRSRRMRLGAPMVDVALFRGIFQKVAQMRPRQ